MKTLLLILSCFTAVSCAQYSGATYAGNGDAGGSDPRASRITSEYKAITFMTDLKAGKFGSKGSTVAGQNQSKVPLSAIRTAGTIGASAIMNGMLETVSNNGSAEVLNASNNAAAIAEGKEITKRAATAGAQALEVAKIPKP